MQCKAHKFSIQGIINKLGVLVLCLAFSSTAVAYIRISSFPYEQNFDDSSYDTNNDNTLVWVTQGATHTWLESGGWRGSGAAKFTPPSNNEGYSGLGQIHFPSGGTNQINVRFMVYYGATWREHAANNKLAIINREEGSGGRAMFISRQFENSLGYWETIGACDGTVCNYQGGDYWPDGTDEYRIGDQPNNREEEWISIELEAFANEGRINIYIHTADGVLSGLYTSQTMARPGSAWMYIDILGGYMGRAYQVHQDNYFIIDNLVIDDSYIGPPQGFVGAAPSPPRMFE
jgi:hypothetical protein